MAYKGFLYSIVLGVLINLSAVGLTYSQDEFIKKSLAESGISEKSRFYSLYAKSPGKNAPTDSESYFWSISKNLPQDIISHYRSTKGEEFKLGVKIEKPAPPIRPADNTKEIIELREKNLVEANKPRAILESCNTDKTDEVSNKKLNSKEGQMLDMLFIKKSAVPLDPELSLGDDVQIFPYDENGQSVSNTAVNGAGIPCLPFRIRATANKVMYDYGKNALKYYGNKK